jgi:hypothetical protein
MKYKDLDELKYFLQTADMNGYNIIYNPIANTFKATIPDENGNYIEVKANSWEALYDNFRFKSLVYDSEGYAISYVSGGLESTHHLLTYPEYSIDGGGDEYNIQKGVVTLENQIQEFIAGNEAAVYYQNFKLNAENESSPVTVTATLSDAAKSVFPTGIYLAYRIGDGSVQRIVLTGSSTITIPASGFNKGTAYFFAFTQNPLVRAGANKLTDAVTFKFTNVK